MEGGSYGAVLRTYWINKVTRWQNTTHTGTVSLLLAKIITTILYGSWSQVTRSISDLTYKFRSFLHSRWELFLCDTGRNAFPEETVTACAESLSPEHPRCRARSDFHSCFYFLSLTVDLGQGCSCLSAGTFAAIILGIGAGAVLMGALVYFRFSRRMAGTAISPV